MKSYQFIIDYLESNLDIEAVLEHMARDVIQEQSAYNTYTYAEAIHAIKKVLSKRAVQNIWRVGIELDKQTEKSHIINEELFFDLASDAPLFGVDEDLGLALSGIYGTIAQTNYGHIDKNKIGVAGVVNDLQKNGERVTVMVDDLVGATVASAEAYLTFNQEEDKE